MNNKFPKNPTDCMTPNTRQRRPGASKPSPVTKAYKPQGK